MNTGDRFGTGAPGASSGSGAVTPPGFVADPAGRSAEEVVDNLWAALQRSKGQESGVPSDADTTDRDAEAARTTPPDQRRPGGPAGSATATGGSTASGSMTVPGSPSTPTSPAKPGATPGGSAAAGSSWTPSTENGAGRTSDPASGTGLAPVGSRTPAPGQASTRNGLPGRDANAPRPDAQTLLEAEFVATVRERWFGVQSAFVDDPESAVREASSILEDSIAEITRGLEKLRRSVTDHAEGANGTEDLRVALLRHREVVGRLLQL
jgi:hypothetical protein